MSDFIHAGWSWYVALMSVVSILACAWLLWTIGRQKVGKKGETTGHVWDVDLVELNNPMPRWWMGLFYITIVFGFAYLALYPGLGAYQGLLGWSQVGQHDGEARQLEAQAKPLYDEFISKDVPALARDSRAMAIGERLFLNNCAQCHGSDARGAKGFPNLADADWLWGGSPEAISQSISAGRNGVMPPMAQALGGEAELENLAHYVMSLSSGGADPLKAALGKEKFVVCAACHGPTGAGNPVLGAPNLTDRVWLYGGGLVAVMDTVRKGRNGVMPAHVDRLSEAQVRVLTAYVWGLSKSAAGSADDGNGSPKKP